MVMVVVLEVVFTVCGEGCSFGGGCGTLCLW